MGTEISQLRTILHVAELGSLSKAADRLRIAQPALSRQVRLLEEELGIRLFVRQNRALASSIKNGSSKAMRIKEKLPTPPATTGVSYRELLHQNHQEAETQ